jgi:CBS domain-containing protein
MSLKVQDVMTRNVVVAHEDDRFPRLVRLMRDYGVSALPVIDSSRRIAGVVSEADLLLKEDAQLLHPRFFEGHHRKAERQKARGYVARELMTAPAITIDAQATVVEAAHILHAERIKRLPVVDPNGYILGVVSRVDVLGAFLRDEDEIVADVQRVLGDHLMVPVGSVQVDVKDSVVLLAGSVERRTAVNAIVDRVRRVEGVADVIERITWDYDDATANPFGVGWVGA